MLKKILTTGFLLLNISALICSAAVGPSGEYFAGQDLHLSAGRMVINAGAAGAGEHIMYFEEDLALMENGGSYYDAQSILRTAPASNIDIATGSDYFYLLFEHRNDTTGHPEIAFKKSVTDYELLLTAGGGPGGMDKYSDIEAMPWQRYLAKGDFDAKDPNVGASGTNVAVVYQSNDNIYGDWNVECWYSTDSGETWAVSTPGGTPQVDETTPAVFVSGNTVYCVFVKQGNLYLTKSEDAGATWDEPAQINEVDGTVIAEPRGVEISEGGIVWVDSRNGNNDIYYAALPVPIISLIGYWDRP